MSIVFRAVLAICLLVFSLASHAQSIESANFDNDLLDQELVINDHGDGSVTIIKESGDYVYFDPNVSPGEVHVSEYTANGDLIAIHVLYEPSPGSASPSDAEEITTQVEQNLQSGQYDINFGETPPCTPGQWGCGPDFGLSSASGSDLNSVDEIGLYSGGCLSSALALGGATVGAAAACAGSAGVLCAGALMAYMAAYMNYLAACT